jgi:glycosyltransferase involved in cell wall biosynthesis
MPFVARSVPIPNENYWGKWFSRDRSVFVPPEEPLRALRSPLNFWELGASRMGFLAEPFAFSVRAFRELARALRAGVRYDVVHDVQCLAWGLLGVRALGLPVVSTVHHPLSVDLRSSLARDRTLREALGSVEFHPVGMQAFVARRLDRIITSSQASAAEIVRDFGVAPGRIRMLGNGIDTELFRPAPGVARSAAELLCVGRAQDPTKGVGTLLAALARLPREVRLTLVDRDDSEAPRRARALGCEDRLTVTGSVSNEELVRLYTRATLVVVPSRYEGFGLPAVEAMACGTPVVASAAGALPEVVEAAGGGILVAPGDAEALAKGIRLLLEQPEQRARLAERARARVEALYAWPRIAEATVEVYRELVS